MGRATAVAQREQKIRVVLADDHKAVRQGLEALLRAEPDMVIVGTAADGKSAVHLIRKTRPDVVLMDINMPVMNGVKATRIIHNEMPGIRVIGLSVYQDHQLVAAIRDAGATCCLTKGGPIEKLIEAIRDRPLSAPPLPNGVGTGDRLREVSDSGAE